MHDHLRQYPNSEREKPITNLTSLTRTQYQPKDAGVLEEKVKEISKTGTDHQGEIQLDSDVEAVANWF